MRKSSPARFSAALIPVVSAVGHEIDFTIADFVADLRAPTPSAAAELIVPAATELDRRINELTVCLQRCWRNFLAREQTRLRLFSERTVGRELLTRIQESKQTLDWRRESLQRNATGFVVNWRSRLARECRPRYGATIRRARLFCGEADLPRSAASDRHVPAISQHYAKTF